MRGGAGRAGVEDDVRDDPRVVADERREEAEHEQDAGAGLRASRLLCRRGAGPAQGRQPACLATAAAAASARFGSRKRPFTPPGPLRSDRAQVVVELVDQRLAGREVQLDDLLGRQAVEMLDERAQRVAVRGDEHGCAACAGRGRSRRTTTAASARARPSGTRRGGARRGGARRSARRSPTASRSSRASDRGRAAARRTNAATPSPCSAPNCAVVSFLSLPCRSP